MIDALDTARKNTAALSEATGELFERTFWKENAKEVGVATGEIRKMVATLGDTKDKYQGIREKIELMNATIQESDRYILRPMMIS